MLPLKGYFDESGDGKGADETSVTVAGYLAPLEAWERLKIAWRDVLDQFGLPYLHMNDFKKRSGPFKRWGDGDPKVVEKREISLFRKLADAVKTSGLTYCCGHTVAMGDLRRFNQEHGLNIDAKAFALAQCMKFACLKNPHDQIEIVIDRMTKPQVVVAEAWGYFRSDDRYGQVTQEPIVSPLPERGVACSQTILPLQVADLFAWEARKDFELKRVRFEQDDPRGPTSEFYQKLREDYNAAKRRTALKTSKPLVIGLGVDPMRGSMTALCDALEPDGCLWRYRDLCEIQAKRNGKWFA